MFVNLSISVIIAIIIITGWEDSLDSIQSIFKKSSQSLRWLYVTAQRLWFLLWLMWFSTSYNTLIYHIIVVTSGRDGCLPSRDSLCIRQSGPWWSLCTGRPGSRSSSIWHSWRAEDLTGRGSASCCRLGTPGGRRKAPRSHTLLHTYNKKRHLKTNW